MRDEGANYGLLVKQYRTQKEWTRAQLAELYGQALREAPMSVEAVRLMEEKNRVPNNPKRRYILAKLLDIPLALFGMAALETLEVENATSTKKRERFDIEHYKSRLSGYWKQHYTATAANIVDDIMDCIYNIRDELPYSRNRIRLLELLCGYHLVLANILRDLQYNKNAITHLNRAYRLAKVLESPVMQGVVLYRRAWVFCDDGNFQQASSDFEVAHTLALPYQETSSQLIGALQLGTGHSRLQSAQSNLDRRNALYSMDAAQSGIDNGEDLYFLRFNAERYHLDRAAALLGAPIGFRAPADALESLSLARQNGAPGYTRRGAYNLILEAQAHMQQGYFTTATALASDALAIVKEIKSQANIARVAALYTSLKETSYRNQPDLAELGVEVMKVQYPRIFQ